MAENIPGGRRNRWNRRSKGGGWKGTRKQMKTSSLIEVSPNQLNGMKDDVPEWEEREKLAKEKELTLSSYLN